MQSNSALLYLIWLLEKQLHHKPTQHYITQDGMVIAYPELPEEEEREEQS